MASPSLAGLRVKVWRLSTVDGAGPGRCPTRRSVGRRRGLSRMKLLHRPSERPRRTTLPSCPWPDEFHAPAQLGLVVMGQRLQGRYGHKDDPLYRLVGPCSPARVFSPRTRRAAAEPGGDVVVADKAPGGRGLENGSRIARGADAVSPADRTFDSLTSICPRRLGLVSASPAQPW